MGGHGALTLFLKNPGMYKSVSAFAPISNPGNCPWGEKAFTGYLGEDRDGWKKHDASELIKGWNAGTFETLIDVGTADNFYKQGQLLPENFEKAAKESGNDKGLVLRYQDVSDVDWVEGKGGKEMLTCSRVMITLTFSFRRFPRIILIMLQNISSHSMLFYCLERDSTLTSIEARRPRDKSYRVEHTMNNHWSFDRTPVLPDFQNGIILHKLVGIFV